MTDLFTDVTLAATDAPEWLTHLVAVAVAGIAIVLSVLHPNGTLTTSSAQAVVLLAGFAIAGGLELGHLISRNGLTKAGIMKSITEEEAWLRANVPELRSLFAAAKPALDQISGVPQLLATVQTDVSTLKARVDAMPAAQRQAVLEVLAGFAPGTPPAVSSAPVSPPASSTDKVAT